MTEREFLERLRSIINTKINLLEPYSVDAKDHLTDIKKSIDGFMVSLSKTENRLHPNAVIKLSNKKKNQEEEIRIEKQKKEMISFNICPKCGGDLKQLHKRGPIGIFFSSYVKKECQSCLEKYEIGTGIK